VTGVTDATPGNAAAELGILAEAVAAGDLPQRLLLMGSRALPESPDPRIARGAVKLVLAEHALPAFGDLVREIEEAHAEARPVAVHCVTRAELVLAVGAFAAAGARAGDRIEHASIAPPDALKLLADLPLTVVTQPNFVHERGDAYAVEVAPEDRPWLYRCRGFDEAAVPLGGGTDAPFGEPEPWAAMRAAVDRRTAQGRTLGAGEALDPERALALFTSPPDAPGAAPRRVRVGAPADLCLLDRPWSRARDVLARELVAATICDGRVVHLA
jgi:predicted amidohydrolase YtcJ